MERANLNELQTFPSHVILNEAKETAPHHVLFFFNVWDNHEMDGEIRKFNKTGVWIRVFILLFFLDIFTEREGEKERMKEK